MFTAGVYSVEDKVRERIMERLGGAAGFGMDHVSFFLLFLKIRWKPALIKSSPANALHSSLSKHARWCRRSGIPERTGRALWKTSSSVNGTTNYPLFSSAFLPPIRLHPAPLFLANGYFRSAYVEYLQFTLANSFVQNITLTNLKLIYSLHSTLLGLRFLPLQNPPESEGVCMVDIPKKWFKMWTCDLNFILLPYSVDVIHPYMWLGDELWFSLTFKFFVT